MLDVTTESGAGADRRLRSEEVIWLTTVRANGQPQSVPVWFLWEGGTFLIYSQPNQAKLRNVRSNRRVALNLNSDAVDGAVVRIEGTAEIAEDEPPASDVSEYVEKYGPGIARLGSDPESFAQAYSVPIRVTPARWVVW